jgi:hypothetical protein
MAPHLCDSITTISRTARTSVSAMLIRDDHCRAMPLSLFDGIGFNPAGRSRTKNRGHLGPFPPSTQ